MQQRLTIQPTIKMNFRKIWSEHGIKKNWTKGGEEPLVSGGGAGERCGGGSSVMVHFKDAAFDDAHVSIPHNLMPERGKNRKRQDI